MGYPGVLGYEALDVQTFAEWDVDYIKLDGCYVDISKMDTGDFHCSLKMFSSLAIHVMF